MCNINFTFLFLKCISHLSIHCYFFCTESFPHTFMFFAEEESKCTSILKIRKYNLSLSCTNNNIFQELHPHIALRVSGTNDKTRLSVVLKSYRWLFRQLEKLVFVSSRNICFIVIREAHELQWRVFICRSPKHFHIYSNPKYCNFCVSLVFNQSVADLQKRMFVQIFCIKKIQCKILLKKKQNLVIFLFYYRFNVKKWY